MSFSKKGLTILLIVLPVFLYSQSTAPKGRFFLNIGPEFRITPTYRPEDQSVATNFTNPDLQNSGPALNIGADYYFMNNFSFGFQNSLRYDLITTHRYETISGGQVVPDIERGLLLGYHFNFKYHFQIFKKGDLIVSTGLSFLNRNSEHVHTEPIFNEEGEKVGSVSTTNNFNLSAYKTSVGYGVGKSKIMMGIYLSRNTNYFEKKTTFMVPFLSYSLDFPIWKRGKKDK
jgi:hypothetical protein